MSRSDLESLTITNLRGVVQPFSLPFDKNRKLCIVYGENGTGKSTLCDALDLLGTDNIGSLDGRGLGRTERYLSPVGQASEGTIELTATGPTVYEAKIKGGRVTRGPNASKPLVRVLRRPQVLKLVNASASERYDAIADLVDVSGVEASEAALVKLEKETERDAERRASGVAAAKRLLEDLFNVAAAAGDPIAWAQREAEADVSSLRGAADKLQALKEAHDALTRRQQTLAAAAEAVAAANRSADAAAADLVALEREAGGSDAALVALLEAASTFLTSHGEAHDCPVCLATTHAADLQARVSERLTALRALQAGMARDVNAKRALEQATQALVREQRAYATERQAFQKAAGDATLPMPMARPPEDSFQLPGWLAESAAAYEAVVQHHARLLSSSESLDRLRAALKTYNDDYHLAERATKLLTVVRAAHERVRSTRHVFVNDVLAQISAEVGRLYEQVHPGEGLGKINLALDAKRRASLELSTSFQTAAAVPPQAYLSDSHLDTLGVCVFLALAKLRDASNAILVLDDVLASVDEPHVDRLVELVYQEASGFRHVLITTHYRPWREKLRWGWLKNGQCQIVELGPWSPGVGPTLVRSTSEVDRLRKLVTDSDFDAQAVCGKAGVVLEAVLDFLTELYELRLPRKPRGAWTLGDLLPAFGKKLRDALRVERQVPADPNLYTLHPLGPIIEELQRVAQARNLLGAHFNKLSFELLDSDAKRFATKVLELADLLVHPEHGWPRSKKSGSYWATPKEAHRLHPLNEPV